MKLMVTISDNHCALPCSLPRRVVGLIIGLGACLISGEGAGVFDEVTLEPAWRASQRRDVAGIIGRVNEDGREQKIIAP